MLSLRATPTMALRALVTRVTVRTFCKDKDYSSSDDEKEPKKRSKPSKTETKNAKSKTTSAEKSDAAGEESAVTRLNRLLASMPTEDTYTLKKVDMARPGEAHKQRKANAKEVAGSKDIFAAAKRVASLLSPDHQKQTESELLSKLLGREPSKTTEMAEQNQSPSSDLSLSELIVGMKVDRSQQPKEETRSEYVRRTLATKGKTLAHPGQGARGGMRKERKREAESYTGSVNLFGCEPLGIFKNPAELREMPDMLQTWAQLQQHDLKLQVMYPPANYFEKLAQWTEQGKVWRFPIDNEQNMQEEADVDFSEHIFLEQYLEPWCPNKGPIRHFMELVCVGLSKNPYITAKDKKEHILWYRDYFEAKKDILKELMSSYKVGAGEKQIEA